MRELGGGARRGRRALVVTLTRQERGGRGRVDRPSMEKKLRAEDRPFSVWRMRKAAARKGRVPRRLVQREGGREGEREREREGERERGRERGRGGEAGEKGKSHDAASRVLICAREPPRLCHT